MNAKNAITGNSFEMYIKKKINSICKNKLDWQTSHNAKSVSIAAVHGMLRYLYQWRQHRPIAIGLAGPA